MATPTNALTYNGYVAQVATMAVSGYFTPVSTTTINGVVYTAGITYGGTLASPDVNFNTIIPMMLNYAELRIQRDLDLLPLETEIAGYSISNSSNKLSISVNDFVTVQTVSVSSAETSGALSPLTATTKEFIQNVYPSASSSGVPQYFAVYGGDAASAGNTSQIITFGPWPDITYSVTITGTTRMPSLYQNATSAATASTNTTFISTYEPDLLVMASMVYISAYQRNFGRLNDDPAMAQTYESQYQTLLRGAGTEEYRKKFEASAWSSYSQSPVATPNRGQ